MQAGSGEAASYMGDGRTAQQPGGQRGAAGETGRGVKDQREGQRDMSRSSDEQQTHTDRAGGHHGKRGSRGEIREITSSGYRWTTEAHGSKGGSCGRIKSFPSTSMAPLGRQSSSRTLALSWSARAGYEGRGVDLGVKMAPLSGLPTRNTCGVQGGSAAETRAHLALGTHWAPDSPRLLMILSVRTSRVRTTETQDMGPVDRDLASHGLID
ncbi:unnamed protein product [Pleuronectes platessa]|uniref:Uncharacterized protein n=1 Tax=Pleuronectes platessa TaxID=8262 RepID=A0A9N7YP61_PLEPL|nr:unnamed protein product [Pleuronectes platessa]